MKILIAFLLISFLGVERAMAQIPPEWQAAAQAVIGELERDTPQAAKPWGNELTQGWHLARAWRKAPDGCEPYLPVALGGLWEGIEITDEDIREARRETWVGGTPA